MTDRTLRVGQCGCNNGAGGIDLTENAFTRFHEYKPGELHLDASPNPTISARIILVDKEIGLDQGRNGFIQFAAKDADRICAIIQTAKKISEMGS